MSKLYFRYGAMNCGKSMHLLAAAHNYLEIGKNPLLWTFAGDYRFGVGQITTRIGVSKPAFVYDKDTDMKYGVSYDDIDAIFVDEAQFLTPTQVKELHEVAIHLNVPVLCYGLRVDFLGRLFEGSQALFAHAETVEEIKTVCECGKKATHVGRYEDGHICTSGETVQIGSSEYKSM